MCVLVRRQSCASLGTEVSVRRLATGEQRDREALSDQEFLKLDHLVACRTDREINSEVERARTEDLTAGRTGRTCGSGTPR